MANQEGEDVKPGFYRVDLLRTVWVLPKRYQDLQPIGNGAFGSVVSALDTDSGERIAIKKLSRPFDTTELAKRSYRELRILQHMKHENVIGLLNLFTSAKGYEDFNDIYLVSQLMEKDLGCVVAENREAHRRVPEDIMRLVVYQLFRALKYVHSAGIIHRDLKTKNIAINQDVMLRVLDFGLASPMRDSDQTGYVVTRWYRSPEIILGWIQYGATADVWSVGCIMGELMTGNVLFRGNSEIEQLMQILELLGSPTEEFLAKIVSSARNYIRTLPIKPKKDLSKVFEGADPQAIDLLERTLVLDPDLRITAEEALEHEYFSSCHDPDDEPISDKFDASYEDQNRPREEWRRMSYEMIMSFEPPDPVIFSSQPEDMEM